jgi:DNA-binding transcriptional ArsR family regulator
MGSLRDAAHENDVFRVVVLLFALAGCFAIWSDMSFRVLVPIIAFSLSIVIGDAVIDAYDLPSGVKGIPFGLALVIVALFGVLTDAKFLTDASTVAISLAFYTVFCLFGAWFVFDGIQQYRYRDHDEQSSSIEDFITDDTDEMMLRFQMSGTVARAVRDEPRTVSELAEDLDLTESRVERSLVALSEEDMVYRSDDTYHASVYMTDKLSPVKRFVRWVPRRLVRPFRMQP